MQRLPMLLLLTAAAAIPAADALARVKLITLPVRERVEVRLDHPTATLVEEERVVPLLEGRNQIDFSWKNVAVDEGTIVFRVLGPADGQGEMRVNVISVTYPPNENALVWDVHASRAGSATVRISYLLGGLTNAFAYRAVAGPDEQTLTLQQHLRVKNFAAEAYADTTVFAGFGENFSRPIGSNETRQMLAAEYENVPVVKAYTVDPNAVGYLDRADDKLRTAMHYVLENTEPQGLGREALPPGKVRIFQQDRRGTSAFLGEDFGRFTPVGDEMRLYVGVAQDVVVRRTIDERRVERKGANLHDVHVVIKYEIENFKDAQIPLDFVENVNQIRGEAGISQNLPPAWKLGPETTFKGKPDPERSSMNRIVLRAELSARDGDQADKITHKLHLVFEDQW